MCCDKVGSLEGRYKIIAETEHTYSCNQYFVEKAASYFLEWNYPANIYFF